MSATRASVQDERVRATRKVNHRTQWLVACRGCGKERWCRPCDVKAGRVDRCLSCATTRHGHAKIVGQPSRLYNIWRGVKHRTGNPKSNRWEHYGGRGITLHPEWAASFATFARDVGNPPSPAHSLDRIDVDGNYEPGNVRWATATEQNANRRVNKPCEGDPFADDDFVDYGEAAE